MSDLSGKKILILRSPDDLSDTEAKIRGAGGEPVSCPVIRLRPPGDGAPLEDAVRRLAEFDWVFFTSGHAVRFFEECRCRLGLDDAPVPAARIAAIGPATAQALRDRNRPIHFTAERSTGEEFVEEFARQHPVRDRRFLLPLSSLAREAVPDRLRQLGGLVTAVTAYVNEPVDELPPDVVTLLRGGQIDWVLFTSSSTARNFLAVLPAGIAEHGRFRAASIGPHTSETLRAEGLEPAVEAREHTLDGLLRSIGESTAL